MQTKPPILVCPLNWGLGHATRDIPIIRQYLEHNQPVVIAGYGAALELLRLEFPNCTTIELPGFEVRYSQNSLLLWAIAIQIPSFLIHKRREHKLLRTIAEQLKPSLIISDNRYGLWHPEVKSVLITHQLKLKLPRGIKWMEKPIQNRLRNWIERFDECWIPDYKDDRSLAGDLSHTSPMPNNARYIGLLSRFNDKTDKSTTSNYVLALASGPEPQRSTFIDILTTQLSAINKPAILITGNPQKESTRREINNLIIYNHLPSADIETLITNAETVICRSGYSSIMDMVRLKKKAIIIPTPGQTEQEYLAIYLNNKENFIISLQKDLNLQELIEMNRVNMVKESLIIQ